MAIFQNAYSYKWHKYKNKELLIRELLCNSKKRNADVFEDLGQK